MKRNYYFSILIASIFLVSLSGCIENENVTFKGHQVEFDAAIYNSPATGLTFPILARVPGYGRAINTATTAAGPADPVITRTSGTINFFVNLVGAHKKSDQTIDISVVTDPITNETLATAGVHYTLPATITIPANSSVAQVPVTILDPGATTGSVVLVIQLDGGDGIAPSENYKKIALRIAQN